MIKATVESQLSVEVPAGAAYELAWPSDEQLDVTLLTPLAEGDRVRVVLLPGARGQNGSISRDGLERSYEAVATMGRLYEHPDYDGRFVTVSDDVIDLDELDFDDAVSSFTFFGEVDPTDLNKTVLLWQHDCAPDQSCYELNGGDAGRIKLRIPLDVAWIEEQYPGWDDRVSALTFGWGHCGDATCQGGEDCESCEADCGACPFCGDEHCNGDETCETCGSDCGPCPVCGDGQCTGDESSFTCAEDCYCGNGTCEWQTERACNCAADCGPRCGDGCCSQGESACGCPSDCYPVCGDGCCTGGEAGYCCADCPWGSRCR